MSDHPTTRCEPCIGFGWQTYFGEVIDCPACNGTGTRPMTDEEINDAAADAWSDRCEGEPPLSLDEHHRRNWNIKHGRGW